MDIFKICQLLSQVVQMPVREVHFKGADWEDDTGRITEKGEILVLIDGQLKSAGKAYAYDEAKWTIELPWLEKKNLIRIVDPPKEE